MTKLSAPPALPLAIPGEAKGSRYDNAFRNSIYNGIRERRGMDGLLAFLAIELLALGGDQRNTCVCLKTIHAHVG